MRKVLHNKLKSIWKLLSGTSAIGALKSVKFTCYTMCIEVHGFVLKIITRHEICKLEIDSKSYLLLTSISAKLTPATSFTSSR